jgi:hypothetical protein
MAYRSPLTPFADGSVKNFVLYRLKFSICKLIGMLSAASGQHLTPVS